MSFFDGWASFLPDLLAGLWVSIRLTSVALVLGLPGGLAFALAAAAPSKLARWIAIPLIELGRGIPALVVLQIVYFGLPGFGLTLTSFLSAALALALTTAAYTSEIIRGALLSVPQGHVEAAHAMGMNGVDTLRHVVLPQATRVAIPALMGFAVLIFQATSLAYTIALPELLSQAYSIGSSTFRYLSILTLAGLLYAAVTVPASLLTDSIERRLGRHTVA